MIRSLALAAGIVLASAIAAAAQNQKTNVQSLLNDGYTIAGITTSQTGGGLVYLQKGSALMLCFVTETPTSTTVDTQYCKPVK
jgi:hypothetical protein